MNAYLNNDQYISQFNKMNQVKSHKFRVVD